MEVILKEDVAKLGSRGDVVKVAEGYGRRGRGEYLQFLGYARGSLREVETCILFAVSMGFGGPAEGLLALCEEIGRVLYGLEESLKRKSEPTD